VWVEDPAHPEGGSWQYDYAITNVEYTGVQGPLLGTPTHGAGLYSIEQLLIGHLSCNYKSNLKASLPITRVCAAPAECQRLQQ
jgi:hypothetical protein